MRCKHCGGSIMKNMTLDGPEYACIACSRPAGTAALASAKPEPRERTARLQCEVCGERLFGGGEESRRGHMNAAHGGNPARFRAAGAEGITPTDRGWML